MIKKTILFKIAVLFFVAYAFEPIMAEESGNKNSAEITNKSVNQGESVQGKKLEQECAGRVEQVLWEGWQLGYVKKVAISSDNKYLVAVGELKLALWDLTTLRCIKIVDIAHQFIDDVKFRPHTHTLAIAYYEIRLHAAFSTIELWTVPFDQPPIRFEGITGGHILSLSFSPDGKKLAFGGSFHAALADSYLNGAQYAIIDPDAVDTKINWLFYPYQELLGKDNDDADSEKLSNFIYQLTYDKNSEINEILFSPDGKKLALQLKDRKKICIIGSNQYTAPTDSILWPFNSSEEIIPCPESDTYEPVKMAFSPDGRYLLFFRERHKEITIWDLKKQKLRAKLITDDGIRDAQFHPQKHLILLATTTKLLKWYYNQDKKPRTVGPSKEKGKCGIQYSLDGKFFISAGDYLTFYQNNGQIIKTVDNRKQWIDECIASKDGTRLGIRIDQSCYLWDLPSLKLISVYQIQAAVALTNRFVAKNHLAVITQHERDFNIIDLETKKSVHRIKIEDSRFSPRLSTVTSGGNHIISIRFGKPPKNMGGPPILAAVGLFYWNLSDGKVFLYKPEFRLYMPDNGLPVSIGDDALIYASQVGDRIVIESKFYQPMEYLPSWRLFTLYMTMPNELLEVENDQYEEINWDHENIKEKIIRDTIQWGGSTFPPATDLPDEENFAITYAGNSRIILNYGVFTTPHTQKISLFFQDENSFCFYREDGFFSGTEQGENLLSLQFKGKQTGDISCRNYFRNPRMIVETMFKDRPEPRLK